MRLIENDGDAVEHLYSSFYPHALTHWGVDEMIFTSMKSVYLLGVLFAFRMLVVVGCRISDDEETTTN